MELLRDNRTNEAFTESDKARAYQLLLDANNDLAAKWHGAICDLMDRANAIRIRAGYAPHAGYLNL